MSSTHQPSRRPAAALGAIDARPRADLPTATNAMSGLGTNLDERTLRWGRRILVFLGYCLATVLMTWPWITRLGTYMPSGGDPLLQI